MNRDQSISTIEALYGIESDTARRLIADVVGELGLGALRDYALQRLAEKQQQEHEIYHGS
jgi:hypothetical protein